MDRAADYESVGRGFDSSWARQKKLLVVRMEICDVCNKPHEKCICCPECGHICSLDYGENYCPVCLPEKKSYGQ